MIPTDWEVKKIGELCEYHNGTSLEHLFNSRNGLRVISIGNYSTEGRYIHRDSYISSSHRKNIEKFVLNKGDLAMSLNDKTSTGAILGRALLIDNDNEFVFNQRTMRLRPKNSVIPSFLHHAINGDYLHGALVSLAKPGTQIYINTDDVVNLLVPVPPVAEQHAIAIALSEMDTLISSLDQLIAKKRDIKLASMQQLLTGQKRLPGFSGKWKVKRLGDVASFLKGKGLAKSELVPYGADPCIHYGELFTLYPETIGEVISRTTGSREALRSIANDVLMPTSDVTPRGLAKASCVTVDGVILGGDILVIRSDSKQIDGSFLSYVIRSHEDQVLQFVSGSTVFHLYGSDMKKFTFSLPPVPEQTAIVNILSDMEGELAKLESRRQQTTQLKQGMMQELLTGRTRLI
ncbi:restriction endonuclease subunit S [Pseudomonas putida]|uniref:restriction endonuclease subunit S n=1 Tax=Pseudomonas putida TaxID=303 RepID=UPI0018A927BD|nr:restriction endonuclease subunit S [Pseudomonas putida]MBF8766307.1 restriction endonuclease subunit S [Pseudomonas putida]